MKILLYRMIQWTWGLPQTLAGFILFLLFRKHPHYSYHGAIVTEWNSPDSVGLGMFIMLARDHDGKAPLLVHEYGHTIQSLILGPLFLLIAGLPSFAWAGLPMARKYRRKHRMSYYAVYPENWANRLGEAVLKEKAPKF